MSSECLRLEHIMDKEILEVVLKKCARDTKITRVIELEGNPALAKGENYTSDISRIQIKVVLGNGHLAKKSFIMKQIHTEKKSGEILQEYSVAKAEANIYTIVHREMSDLMEEFEDWEETLWCHLVHYDISSSSILLEDLKPLGYNVVPRQEGLDLEHSLLALRGLGKYHGMAKVLEQRGIINQDNYRPFHAFSSRHHLKIFTHSGLRSVAKTIKANWGPDLEEIANKILDIPFEPFADKLMSFAKPLDSEFTVLNHGDCWSNNMMFKHDWRNRPISVKFIDFQLPHHHTPCLDITNLMYISVQPQVRRQNYHLLLKTYHDCLVGTLDKFGYSGTKPSLQEITSTMDRLSFFALSVFIMGYPITSCSSTEAFDVEKILQTDGESGFNSEIINEPGIKEKMKDDIVELVQKHLPIV